MMSFYRRHTAKIRAIAAWLLGGFYLIATNSAAEMTTWTARRWAFEFLTKLGPGFLLLMGAGDRNAPSTSGLAPLEPPK